MTKPIKYTCPCCKQYHDSTNCPPRHDYKVMNTPIKSAEEIAVEVANNIINKDADHCAYSSAANRILDAIRQDRERWVEILNRANKSLKEFIPEKEYGPWNHHDGCRAEYLQSTKDCTCGTFVSIDEANAVVKAIDELLKEVGE